MKTSMITLLLVALAIFCKAQTVDWDLVEQHYFETYQPTDTPAWIFPIIAINGDGQQDTIYYCYDPNAQTYNFNELNYGEIKYKIDSTDFQFSFYAASLDSFYNVQAFGNPLPEIGGFGISIRNSKYPLTLKWNGSKLYDTILPFPNILPKPIARIGGFWGHYYTPFILGTAETFIIADTAGIGSICLDPVVNLIRDSIIFDGPLSASPDDFLGITLSLRKQSDGCIIGSVQNPFASKLILIEHLKSNKLTITSLQQENTDIRIFDFYGRAISSLIIHPFQSVTIDVNQSTKLLIIQANTSTAFQTIKIINP